MILDGLGSAKIFVSKAFNQRCHKNYLNQKFDELPGNIKAKGNVAMKRKRLGIFGYCLVVGLFTILIVGVPAC